MFVAYADGDLKDQCQPGKIILVFNPRTGQLTRVREFKTPEAGGCYYQSVRREAARTEIGDVIGRRVRKMFPGHGVYMACVTDYENPHYRLIYDDGNKEDLTPVELGPLLVPAGDDSWVKDARNAGSNVGVG